MSIAIVSRKIGPGAAAMIALGLMLGVTAAPTMIEANAAASEVTRTGTFVGENKHVTTGKVTIRKDGEQTIVVLGPKFSLDGAPAPTLGFSKDGAYDKASEFSKLNSLSGSQTYVLPAGLDTAAYDTIHVWCSDFSVSLGSAKLN